MKLLTRTSLTYFVCSLLIFTLGGISFYFYLGHIIHDDNSEELYREQARVLQFVRDSSKIPDQSFIMNNRISFVLAPDMGQQILKDTLLYNNLEEEQQPYLLLTFPASIEGQTYAVTISKGMFDTEDLRDAIVLLMCLTLLAVLALLIIATRWFSMRLWQPYYKTLGTVQAFDANSTAPSELPPTHIQEFDLLNREVGKMMARIRQDYRNLKEFTENTSHEIQTPLAILRSKLEIMLSWQDLPPNRLRVVQDMYESTNRLSQLNQSLLLLTRIENRQFHETVNVDFATLVGGKLEQFEEMIAFKELRVAKNVHDSPSRSMNPQLADILVSNLLGNAIRHNQTGGRIAIEMDQRSMSISNSGPPLHIPPEKLFQRFQRDEHSTSSQTGAGLGLAIVKQICDSYNFTLNYDYSDGIHTISVHL